jgi:membrane-associated protein
MDVISDFFRHLGSPEELIRWGGYTVLTGIIFTETGLLIGFFLPGDSLLVSSGVLIAAYRLLDIWVLTGLLCAASIIGDTVGYWFGRTVGPRLFARPDSLFFSQKNLLRAQRFYERYGGRTIIIARFVPVVRTFAPVVAGIAEMHYGRFLTYNALGGIGWICSMLLGGYFLGSLIPDVEKNLHIVIVLVVAVSLLPVALEFLKARRGEEI